MHLPDGYLDTKTALLTTGVAVAGVGLALREVRRSLEPRQMSMLGLAAAFVFAAQMLNFPVAGGSSGHVIGGVLTAVLLGPSAAIIVLTCVLMVQCLMFADGGLMALGANIFNMGLVSVCGGYFVFCLTRKLVRTEQNRATVLAAAFAAWFGTVLAAVACAGELAFSGTSPWSLAFPAMVNVHILIGIGEGLATGLITMVVLRARPELVAGTRAQPDSVLGFIGYGLLVSAGLALFVAPFACGSPDGLEALARRLGFAGKALPPVLDSPLADYRLPFIGSPTRATALAGLIGTVLAFVAAYVLACMVVPVLAGSRKDAKR